MAKKKITLNGKFISSNSNKRMVLETNKMHNNPVHSAVSNRMTIKEFFFSEVHYTTLNFLPLLHRAFELSGLRI